MQNNKIISNSKLKSFFNSLLFVILAVYSTTIFTFERASKVALILLVIFTLVYLLLYNRSSFKTVPFYFIYAAIIIAILTYLLNISELKEIIYPALKAGYLLDKFLFVIIAFVIIGSLHKAIIILILSLISFLSTPFIAGGGVDEIINAYNGLRTGFGGHIITMGIVASFILLATIALAYRALLSQKYRWLYLSFLVVVLLTTSFWILASQTRAVFLTLFVVLVFSIAIAIYYYVKHKSKRKVVLGYFAFISSFIVSLILVLLLSGLGNVADRVSKEQSVFWSVLTLQNIKSVEKNSAGYRVHFWHQSINKFLDKPVFGHGVGAGKEMHKEAGNFFGDRNFHTVHNDFFEVLITYGVVGFLLFAAFIIWIYREIYQLYTRDLIGLDILMIFNLFLLVFMMNSIFMSLLWFDETLFLWNLILGAYLSVVLNYKHQGQQNA